MTAALITAADVARQLGCSPRTVQRLAENGHLPYEMKLPGVTGSYLFSRSAVEMFIASRAAPAKRAS